MKTLKSLTETFRSVAKHEQGVRKLGVTAPPKKFVGNTPVSLKGNVPAPTLGSQEFIDDHEIEMVPDVNGNGDDVFKATNIKMLDRKKEKHGHTAKDSEAVNEKMSPAEMKKREDIVKGMKKNISSFTQRYGKDAKSVMYATATKNAMKEEVEEQKYDCILEATKVHQEEQELVEAYATILESIYEGLNTEEDKQRFEEMLESEDAFDELVELVEGVVAEGDE